MLSFFLALKKCLSPQGALPQPGVTLYYLLNAAGSLRNHGAEAE